MSQDSLKNKLQYAGNPKGTIRVQIIQPLIPEYRVSLFRRLAAHDDLDVTVSASMRVPGIDNLVSVDRGEEYADLDHPCKGFWGNSILWQRGLRLDPMMRHGDVLVVNVDFHYLSTLPLVLRAKKRGIGIVWWGHGFSTHRNRFKDFILRMIVYLNDVRLLYTDDEINEYLRLGCSAKKLFATNNALDLEPIEEAKKLWPAERLREFQKKEDIEHKHLLLFCGRRIENISFGTAFAALAQLKRVCHRYLFVIIGPDESRGELGKVAKELGVNDCLRWLGPIYDQSELAPWFLSARCFVFPGSIGLSLTHAFAYGLPVIVPDCEHYPEIAALSNGENGLFYRNGDKKDLAEKIAYIVENKPYQQDLSVNALETIRRDYNMDNMVRRFIAAIKAASARSL